jgi:hypothetical protein
MISKAPIKQLKLPFTFDEQKLVKDLNTLSNNKWISHHYTMNYDGDWTSIALYAKHGKKEDIFASSSNSGDLIETPLLKKSPYFKEVIQQFKSPLISARLLRLGPGSIIKPHQDFKLGYEDNNFRLHIPIITNDQIEFILAGEKIMMAPGECWYTNVNFTHSVVNKGKEDRIHLVLDYERDAWSDKIFFSLAPRKDFHLKSDAEEVIRQTIVELKRNNDPTSIEIIKTLEKQLKTIHG